MLAGKKSEYVLGSAPALPWLFRLAVETALKFHDYRKGNPHWLLLALKE